MGSSVIMVSAWSLEQKMKWVSSLVTHIFLLLFTLQSIKSIRVVLGSFGVLMMNSYLLSGGQMQH